VEITTERPVVRQADRRPRVRNRSEDVPCKICGTASALDGVVDFNKNASEPQNVFLPLCGVPVYYHRCPNCGCVFTVAFDDWSLADFSRHIYDEAYAEVDPDYREKRPIANARLVANFITRGTDLRVLDYGGGNGRLARELVALGVAALSWDPMEPGDTRPPVASFDLVTCFEVAEHTPTPVDTFADALSYLRPGGVMLFSTLTIDGLPPRGLHHWYIAPRNGHLTIYTKRGLALMAERFARRVHHFDSVYHLCHAEIPGWIPSAG
jgi:2-polyprenyl-6-hydroxyphenyl methylase/3-demethylubiquinone-9 3-methyltransferase